MNYIVSHQLSVKESTMWHIQKNEEIHPSVGETTPESTKFVDSWDDNQYKKHNDSIVRPKAKEIYGPITLSQESVKAFSNKI